MDSFEIARSEIFDRYKRGDYANCLGLAEDAHRKYPEHRDSTLYWLACFASLLGKKEEALAYLEEAHGKGIWWSVKELEGDSDLESIRSEPRFATIKRE